VTTLAPTSPRPILTIDEIASTSASRTKWIGVETVVPTTDDTLLLSNDREAVEDRALAAVLVTAAAKTQLEEVCREYEEHRHEARAALLGIEAAARALSRHRDLMTDEEIAQLADGLVAEVQRLRALIDARFPDPSTFELEAAIAPVITCMRVEGLVIDTSIPQGLRVEGVPAKTAQVVLALLTNALCYAPDSHVEIRATQLGGSVELRVEDRGPGVAWPLRDEIFDRGVTTHAGHGDGLGLFVARRLMEEQHGSLSYEERAGGGASFVVLLPLAHPE
jgi:signal transduction histidine kinase